MDHINTRIYVGYKVEIQYRGERFEGVIENLSSKGVNIITGLLKPEVEFVPNESLEVKFEPVPGEILIFNCHVRWSKRTQSHCLTCRIGLEIENPPWEQSESFI